MRRRKSRVGTARAEPTAVLAARVKIQVFDEVVLAAELRGVLRQEIVEVGAHREAMRIIQRAVRALHRHKERQRAQRRAARRQKGAAA
jgi:hypothetical protein